MRYSTSTTSTSKNLMLHEDNVTSFQLGKTMNVLTEMLTLLKTYTRLNDIENEVCPQRIKVVLFIILNWIFVLLNVTTMIPCRRVS